MFYDILRIYLHVSKNVILYIINSIKTKERLMKKQNKTRFAKRALEEFSCTHI